MEDELRKIDIIRERFNVSYEEADAALKATSGEVVSALMIIEKQKHPEADLIEMAGNIVNEAQRIVERGPIKKLRIKLGDKILKEIPVALSAAAAFGVVLAAVLVTNLVIEADRGEDENVCCKVP